MARKTPETPEEDRGPWWVEAPDGSRFAWHVKADIDSGDLKATDETPFASDGSTLRTPIPAGATDPAPAVQEGESR